MGDTNGAVRISIGRADRVALFGRTGSGKTTLARHLLQNGYARARQPYVVLDPKRTYRDDGVPIVRDFKPREERQIIRDDGFLDTGGMYDFYDWQLQKVWEHGHRIVYVDEATLVTPPRSILPALGACIRTGRERDVATWVGSQRPKELPSPIFTEAEHFFVFRLQWLNDRAKVASFTHDAMLDHMERIKGRARKHDCVYYDVSDDRLVYLQMTSTDEMDRKRARRQSRRQARAAR